VIENRVLRRIFGLKWGEVSINVIFRMYKSILFPAVLYGCETCSLTLLEEHRLRVIENRVLRRTFGLKWGEVTGGWRKLHKEELRNFYSSPSKINDQVKYGEMDGVRSTNGREEKCI
jgi:hypothetical protein